MKVVFTIERDEETGAYTASWDDLVGGGITTQAEHICRVVQPISEAIRCHFADRPFPEPLRFILSTIQSCSWRETAE